MAVPQSIIQDLKTRLREYIISTNDTVNDTTIKEIRDELTYQFRRVNAYPLQSDLDEILKAVDESAWIKKIHGPFLSEIRDFVSQIDSQVTTLCQNVLEADNEAKLKKCVADHRQLMIINLILNERTDNQTFNQEVRQLIFDTDLRLRNRMGSS